MAAESESKPILLGIGNPLLDISAHVSQDYLDKYGLKLNNAILAEEEHKPMYQEMVDTMTVEYIAGGATQNTIRVAQWMMQTPGATAYAGCIGKDAFGLQLRRAAEADGVTVHYLEDEHEQTGTCAVLVKDGERSLVANLGAANCYKEAHAETADLVTAMESARFYYIAGFFLTVSPPTIMRVARHAAEHNKVFAMNLSAPFLVEFFKEPMMAALPHCDYLFGNESEAAKFGEVHGVEGGVEAVARHIAALPKVNEGRPRTVVITQGCDPTLVVVNGTCHMFPVELLPKEALVDTNGAGDAFAGGFMARLVQGADIEECVQAGHYSARVIIQRSGCTFPREAPAFEWKRA